MVFAAETLRTKLAQEVSHARVHHHVPSDVFLREEAPIALVARELLLVGILDGATARMDLQVVEDFLLGGEHAGADLTLQAALFGRVQGQVFLVADQGRVLLFAVRFLAHVHFLAGTVHLYVVLQVVLAVEGTFAHRATERLTVRVDEYVAHLELYTLSNTRDRDFENKIYSSKELSQTCMWA